MFVETKTIQTYFDQVAQKLDDGTRQALTLLTLQTGLAKLAVFPQRLVIPRIVA